MLIRPANDADFEEMWEIFTAVVATGDTYVFAPDTSRDEARAYFLGPTMASFVALIDDRVVGMYKLIANRRDLGSHVANASYMVHPSAAGKGVGRAMGEHSLEEARTRGYLAMQFNFVVSTNTRAVQLWTSLGFDIVATLPNAFKHQTLGYVDAYVMHQTLVPIFGRRHPGVPYVVRPSVYGLIMNERGELAVARSEEGLFLPGGGIDPGETPHEALAREVREECALEIEVREMMGRSIDIVLAKKKTVCFEKRNQFFRAYIHRELEQAAEHALVWIAPALAATQVKDRGHAWVIERLEAAHDHR